MKKKKIISILLLAIISSFFFVNQVKAYFTDSCSISNEFTIFVPAEHNVTFIYSYLDENDVKHELNPSEQIVYEDGIILELSTLVDSSVDYSKIDYYVDNNLYVNENFKIDKDATIEIVYTLNRYNITYELDDGILENPITTYTVATETFDLPIPSKEHYIFKGWNGNSPYTITKGSTGDITVTANWEAVPTYFVTLNNNYDVDIDPVVQIFYEGEEEELDSPFTRTGYEFIGWSLTEDGEVIYQPLEVIAPNDNMSLYARWEKLNICTVTFVAGNGGNGSMDPQTFICGVPQKLSPNTFIKNGKSFSGWTNGGGKTILYYDEEEITIDSDITLTARFD